MYFLILAHKMGEVNIPVVTDSALQLVDIDRSRVTVDDVQ